ncbi:MAG: tRNA(Ile)-lysidine synthase [Nitrospirales bacterium]|nr:MAG: tRNA(Ile)-lysidine synthase [Nitrospirales bacterium]
MTFIPHVEKFMNMKQMLERDDHVLISVSGGPDSVALLSLLHTLREKWNLTLSVVHFDHGLRGRESEEDARFVACLCQGLEIPCFVEKLHVQMAAVQTLGRGLQDYARNMRYQHLSRIVVETGATKIATGHTLDDQAETVVMRMVRGAGAAGLCGIPAIRESHIIRPLLKTRRETLLAYLKEQGLPYRVDSSNQKFMYLRNRIRHEIMPLLKQYNPNVTQTLARQAEIVCEEEVYLNQLALAALANIQKRQTSNTLSVCRTGCCNLPLAMRRRVIRLAIQSVTEMSVVPGFDAVDTILRHISKSRSGSAVIAHGVSIIREYGTIHFSLIQRDLASTGDDHGFSQELSIPARVLWPLTGQTLEVSQETGIQPDRKNELSPHMARFDADTFDHSLTLRSWQEGDRFYPLGMSGKRKKLQDFFSDIKLPRSQRSMVPLLVAPEGIVWVGGYRMDHRFRVTETTQRVLVAQLSQELKSV